MSQPPSLRFAVVAVVLALIASPLVALLAQPSRSGEGPTATAQLSGGTGTLAPTAAVRQPSASHAVVFSESGLPPNLTWQVTLGRVTESYFTDGLTDSLTFSEPDGTYAYAITNLPGWQQTTLPYSGSVVVSGADVNEPTIVYSAITYAVNFSESGLPASLTWQVTVGGSPQALITDGGTDSLIFQEANGSYAYSITDISGWHQTTLPYHGSVVVNGAAVTEPTLVYTQVTYSVVFSESGLPAGLTWQIAVNGVLKSLTTVTGTNSLTWTGLPNGSYAYSIANIAGWNQSTLPYSGSVTVNGATVNEPTLAYTRVTYAVVFSESGLPPGLTWQVTVGRAVESAVTDGGTDDLTFALANGSYPYSIAIVSGWEESTIPPSGTVVVNGAPISETTAVYTEVTYSETFTESGLPVGTSWSVTLGGTPQSTTSASLQFNDPNGTYSFSLGIVPGYAPSPSSGSLTVNGAPTSTSITFSQVKYALTFTESGLPSGTSWSVQANGTTLSSTSASIVFQLPNGTYDYSIPIVPGYTPSAASGTASLAGGPNTVAIPFSQVLYTATFTETGLPATGAYARWSVALDGVLLSSTGRSISFPVANGSHTYLIRGPVVYEVSATLSPEGTIVVNGANVSQAVSFLRGPTYVISFRELGLAVGTSWCVTIDAKVCSTTSTLAFRNLTPGAYGYSIGSVPGLTAIVKLAFHFTTPSGSVSVPTSKAFLVRYSYPVTFTETGLPGGTSWKVSGGGFVSNSTTNRNVLYLINGTYAFYVLHVKGYNVAPSTGRLQVAGGPLSVAVRFTPAPLQPSAAPLGIWPSLVAGSQVLSRWTLSG